MKGSVAERNEGRRLASLVVQFAGHGQAGAGQLRSLIQAEKHHQAVGPDCGGFLLLAGLG